MATETKKILVVDDNRLTLNILRKSLQEAGYQVVSATSGLDALKQVEKEVIHLILLDVVMPDMDGYEVIRQLRNNTRTSHIPIILVSSRASLADKVQGFEAGADDYITKPFELLELLARVMAHMRSARRARSISPLTGLPGNIRIEDELKERVESGEKFAVLYVDMDNFKAYNDAYGFLQGDEAIKLLARTMEDVARQFGHSDDLIGHIGGDDFVVVTRPEVVDAVCGEVITRFDRAIKLMYDPEDRERNGVLVLDRAGREVRYPVISLSIGVISNEHRVINSHWEVGEIAAGIKHKAKSLPGSVYVKDERPPIGSVVNGSGCRVLVVEDDRLISALLRGNLEHCGYEVDVAGSAMAALQSIKERVPDLLVLDVVLPGTSGYMLCRKLKGDPHTSQVAVLMVSSSGNPETAAEAGADAFLAKPFDIRKLLQVVYDLLREQKQKSANNN